MAETVSSGGEATSKSFIGLTGAACTGAPKPGVVPSADVPNILLEILIGKVTISVWCNGYNLKNAIEYFRTLFVEKFTRKNLTFLYVYDVGI